MKKALLILVMLLVAAFSTACGDTASASAYERIHAAWAELEEATSMSMDFVMEMEMESDSESFHYLMEGRMDMNMDNMEDIQFAMFTSNIITMDGETFEMSMDAFFRDGYYFIDIEGEQQFKMPMPLEDALEQAMMFDMEFAEEAIRSQEVSGNRLSFVLDGEHMSAMLDEMTEGMTQMLGPGAQIEFGDVYYTATLSGQDISQVTMETEFTMTAFGETTTVAMTMTMNILQTGNVTIDFPAGLDNFMEVDPILFGF